MPTSSGLYESMQYRSGGKGRAQGAVGRKGRGGRRGAPDGQPKGGKHTGGGEGQVEDPHTTTTRKRAHPPRHSNDVAALFVSLCVLQGLGTLMCWGRTR